MLLVMPIHPLIDSQQHLQSEKASWREEVSPPDDNLSIYLLLDYILFILDILFS